jgi:hypothetical protein
MPRPFISFFPFAQLVNGGLLGGVGDRLGNDALQGSNPWRQHYFLGHRLFLSQKYGERMLAL